MPTENTSGHILLGLDIGVASIGWALIAEDDKRKPTNIIRAGSHTFDAGVEGNVESGRDKARGAARREARLPRRMTERRQRRRRRILHVLQRAGLLPTGDTRSPQDIHDYLLSLDAELRRRHPSNGDRIAGHVLPYRLRAAALDGQLEPCELGRAFYHLAQRRGFLSNRKSLRKDEDEGAVKKGITDLQAAMHNAAARTLGEYFAGLDPETERIRCRWTARQMYIDEFNLIYDAQSGHHPNVLTDDFRKDLYSAVFFQRPLKSQRHLIGRCELVPGARRAALADRTVQRFRILQKVNDLRIRPPASSERPLTRDERLRLIDALTHQGDLTFARIKSKKCLDLPKGTKFNFEQDDEEKRLPGHRTDAKLREVFAERWDAMPDDRRDQIVLEILSFQNPDALARRAIKAWDLDEDSAQMLAETRLEQGYAAHSRKALRMLVEKMEDGTPYATARKQLFPDSFEATDPVDVLPPVRKAIRCLRNPAVERALTELRKLVNEIVRVYGKPDRIRIELARDLKRSRKQRVARTKEIDANTKLRENAKNRILDEMGLADPRRPDIEKVLLADECNWTCPYTGRQIAMRSLIGDQPQFDVEHIFPFSRSLDNSFFNKTLCYHEENRERKGNQTPFEAYGADKDRYPAMLERVHKFQGRAAREKLRRFKMTEIPEDFVDRQLNDTRYASTLAGDYLGLLYGGRSDASGTQRIQVSTGGITAHLRNEWDLNGLFSELARGLGVPDTELSHWSLNDKKRVDHRHHAVDAIAVALASPGIVRQLQRAAERASEQGRRRFAQILEPWPGFLDDARRSILDINVSHRLTKRIAGGLHADTNYSKPHAHTGDDGKTRQVRHVRKPLSKMSVSEINNIVDPVIRNKVRAQLARIGGDPKAFNVPENLPTQDTPDGRQVPIRRARVRKVVNVVTVGQGPRARNVAPGSNHHAVIVASLDKDGKESRWDDHPVTRLQTHEKRARRQPVIQRDWGEHRRFKFSLSANEYVVITDANGAEQLCRLLSVSKGKYEFRRHTDARMASEARKKGSGARIILGAEAMRQRNARKVRVTYLGEIIPAND